MDERTLPDVAELLRRNTRLATVKIVGNRISCTEFERFGLDLMRLLSSNNTVTVRLVLSVNVGGVILNAGAFFCRHTLCIVERVMMLQICPIKVVGRYCWA